MAADKSHLRKNSEKASVSAIVAQNNETLSKLISGERTKLGFNNKNASDYIKSSTSDNAVSQVRQEAYEKTTPLNEGWVGELGSVIVDKVKGAYDFMSSDEGIDRRGVDGSGQEYLTSDARVQQAADDEIVNRSEQAFQDQNKNLKVFQANQSDAGPEVPKTLSSDTSDIPAEYVLRGEAEDGGDLYLKSNGKSYADVLQEFHAEKGEEVSGALFTKNAEDIIGTDRDSDAQREYLDSGEALLPDGSYEATEGRDFHAHLGEKAEADAKAKAQQKRFEDILDRQDDELHGGEIAAKNNYDKMNLEAYNKQKEEEKLAAGRQRSHDRFQNKRLDKIAEESDKAADANRYANQFNDSQNTETESKNYFEVGEKAEESAEAIAEVADEINTIGTGGSAVQTANANNEAEVKGLKEQEVLKAERFAAAQAEAKANAEKLNAELKQERLDKTKENAESTPLGESQNERLDDIKSQENLKSNAKTTPLGQSVLARENQKKTSLATQLKQKEIELYQNQINNPTADDIAGESHFYDKQRGTGGINRGKFRNTFRQGADDPFAFSTLSYPRNLTNSPQIGHYLLFYVNVQNKTGYEYEGVTPTDGDYSVGDIFERQVKNFTSQKLAQEYAEGDSEIEYKTSYHYEKGADKGDIGYQKRQIQSGAKGNHLKWNQRILSKGRKPLTSMRSVHNTTTRITDSVALYLPANVENNTSVSYQDFETGMAGFLALGGKGILDKIIAEDYEGAASKFMGMSGTVLVEMLKKVGVEAVGAFTGGQGVQQAFDKAFGQTLNPYLEVAFQSMGVRSFSYTFNFTPRNEDESKDVRAIIELFRFHMLPELKGAQHRYLTLPSTFDIHYMYQSSPETAKENDFYHKIATCVLTKCNVDYTPDGVKSFDSGAPVASTMTLEFMETEMLTKEKVQQGF